LYSIVIIVSMEDEEETKKVASSATRREGGVKKDMNCPRCGLRSYDDICANCGAPIIDTSDDEEEDYNWREKYR